MGISRYTERYPARPVQLLHVRVQGGGGLECEFHRAVLELGNRCDLLEADESWEAAMGRLRWLRALVGSTPLALAGNPYIRPGLVDTLAELAAGTSDGELARLAGKAGQALGVLLEHDTSPLLTACLEQLAGLGTGTRVGVLLENGRDAPAVLGIMGNAGRSHTYSVGTWATICQGPTLDRLFLFGTGERQPPGLYKSGIAQAYTRIAYAWARPEPTSGPWFSPYTGHEDGMWGNYRFEAIVEGEPWYASEASTVDAETGEADASPNPAASSIPWNSPESDGMSQWLGLVASERVPARRVLLGGGRAIYLGGALREGAFVLGRGGAGVHEVPVLDLAPGDWLVVPTAAGGDYRRALVDIKLGKNRDECRRRQDAWKTTLAQRVTGVGMDAAVQQLRALGCKRANPSNLANWAYGSVVCPQRQADFAAIMAYLGRDREYAERSYRLLKMIHSAAHQVDDILERELKRGLVGVNPDELDGEAEYPASIPIGKDQVDFTLVQVASLGLETTIERGRLGTITNNTDNE